MLTQFQKTFVRQLQDQPGFSHFCGYKSYDHLVEYQQQFPEDVFVVLVYVADKLQAYRIGKKRVLFSVTV
jgi:hypothetical protein